MTEENYGMNGSEPPVDEKTVHTLGILSLVLMITFPIAGLVTSIVGYSMGKKLLAWAEDRGLKEPEMGYRGFIYCKIALFVSIALCIIALLVIILALVIYFIV